VKLKLDENGVPVIQDGQPVYVHEDGKEVAVDVPQLFGKIGQLNEEAKTHRLKAKEALDRLASFDGIEDPDAARTALQTVSNLDAKKLIDAGEAEKVKKAVEEAYQGKLTEAEKKLQESQQQIFQLMVGGAFRGSKFVSEKLTIPSDMAQSFFGTHFRVEDGQVVAFDKTGNKILSREKPGEPASFDEALEFLIQTYPHKDAILKGGKPGSGGGGGGNPPPSKKPSEMSEAEKSQYITDYGLEKWLNAVTAEAAAGKR